MIYEPSLARLLPTFRFRPAEPVIFSRRSGRRSYFAQERSGALIHVSGAAVRTEPLCCPDCGDRMEAVSPRLGAPFYLHTSGNECPHAGRRALEQVATTIFPRFGRIELPRLSYGGQNLLPGTRAAVANAKIEPWTKTFGPDLCLTIRDHETGDHPLIVMFDLGHGHDQEKAERLRGLAIDLLLIDLRGYQRKFRMTQLADVLIKGAPRYWLHHRLIGPIAGAA